MATQDLQTFLEDRLQALDPSIDLDPGSPAQVQFITPVLKKLGTDPFETDIDSFITDRFRQEFPDIYAEDPSAIRDVFVKPLIMLLEPIKREIQAIKLNQSLKDPTVLSDDDADALAANVFTSRSEGGFSTGQVRVFFSSPINVQIELTHRFYTASGLGFFPVSPVTFSAEEMVFNREGSLYFIDLTVKAEAEGDSYNISEGELTGVNGVFSAVKVTNLDSFANGATQKDTPTFVQEAQEALTERSLVTRRGANARIKEVFPSDVRAVQVIGAGDEEMQRDLLVATGPGHTWLMGDVSLYQSIALLRCSVVEGSPTADLPVVGDSVFVYLDPTNYPAVANADRIVRLEIEEILFSGVTDATYVVSHLLRVSGAFPTGVTPTYPLTLRGGAIKNATVRISSLADVGAVSLTAESGDVHVYGHADVYIRPVLQPTSTAILNGVYDDDPLVEGTDLITYGAEVTDTGVVQSTVDFEEAGVTINDFLIIESGLDAGIYRIGLIAPGSNANRLALTQSLTKSATGIRFRVVRKISIDPFEPKIHKVPFGATAATDLSTSIGSTLMRMSTVDLLVYGATVGDTIRVLTGSSDGDYTIVGFDSTLGGKGPIVDRELGASEAGLSYQVFTKLDPVELPLVRIKSMEVLDSAEQPTGVTVPLADPIAVVPTGNFTTARVRASSLRATGCVLPDLTGLFSAANLAAGSGDRRYSLGFDTPDGYYKSVEFADGEFSELDFRADTLGKCSWFVSTSEYVDETENFPPIDPKPGECLSIKEGPNTGDYLIRQVVKFKYHDADGDIIWVYFIQIYGEFPFDVIKDLIDFCNDVGGGAAVTELPLATEELFPDFFTDILDSFGAKIHAAFGVLGLTSPGAVACQEVVDGLTKVKYSWGDPARGVLRSYFLSPTVFEQWTADHATPTIYEYTTSSGAVIQFRPDPARYLKHDILPSRLDEEVDALDLDRGINNGLGASIASLTDRDIPSTLEAGVSVGDYVSIHEEIDPAGYGTTNDPIPGVQTTAGSPIIVAPTASGAFFTADMVGALLFIEDGPDAGGYRITEFISTTSVSLDRALTDTTPSILLQGTGASWGYDAGITATKLVHGSSVFTGDHLNKYLTMYGMNSNYQGTWKITQVISGTTVKLDQDTSPAYDASVANGTARWVVTDAPTFSLEVRGSASTELYGVRGVRLYEAIPQDLPITALAYAVPSSSIFTVTGNLPTNTGSNYHPYRIYRSNIRRITPTEMAANQDGPYYYFDTEVCSLSPLSSANIVKDSYLTVRTGTYKSVGYRFSVDDPNLTYSMSESGRVHLPLEVLPIDNSDVRTNYINLVGASIKVTYERSAAVENVQTFLDSPQDRVLAANLLARHFLPAYVSCDISYTGGESVSSIAKDIIEYLNNLAVETALDVSEVESMVTKNGGNPRTPIRVMAEIHDWSRKVWVEFGDNEIGGAASPVPYNGTPKVAFFRPGPDVSGEDPVPSGERIKLTRT